jgi:hypothetical protein
MIGLNRRFNTEKAAKKIAGDYNAYAERMSWPAQRRAYVEAAGSGKFRIRFTRTFKELRDRAV